MENKEIYSNKSVGFDERKENVITLSTLTHFLALNDNFLYNQCMNGEIKNPKLRELIEAVYADPAIRMEFEPKNENNVSPVYAIINMLSIGKAKTKGWDSFNLVSDNKAFKNPIDGTAINALDGALKCYAGKKDESGKLGFNAKAFLDDIVIDRVNHRLDLKNKFEYSNAMLKFIGELQDNKRFQANYETDEIEKN